MVRPRLLTAVVLGATAVVLTGCGSITVTTPAEWQSAKEEAMVALDGTGTEKPVTDDPGPSNAGTGDGTVIVDGKTVVSNAAVVCRGRPGDPLHNVRIGELAANIPSRQKNYGAEVNLDANRTKVVSLHVRTSPGRTYANSPRNSFLTMDKNGQRYRITGKFMNESWGRGRGLMKTVDITFSCP